MFCKCDLPGMFNGYSKCSMINHLFIVCDKLDVFPYTYFVLMYIFTGIVVKSEIFKT